MTYCLVSMLSGLEFLLLLLLMDIRVEKDVWRIAALDCSSLLMEVDN